MRARLVFLVVVFFVLACDGSSPRGDAGPTPDVLDVPDVPDGTSCADLERLRICEGGVCREDPCRGDEVCEASACVPWTEASLFADFTLSVSDRTAAVMVLPGGFPRARAEALRFTFGDGAAGWGEVLRHTYAEPGVYPIELEVRLTGHRVLRASRVAVIAPLGEHAPLFVTVNEIPRYLNGSVPLTRTGGTRDDPSDDVMERFMLKLPRSGFTVDVLMLDDPDDPIDRASLSLTASAAFGSAAAGAELVDRLIARAGEVTRSSWLVAAEDALPEGQVTLTLRGHASSGAEHTSSITFEAVTLSPERDPFDRPMTWLFRETDLFAAEPDPEGGIAMRQASNGVPDLIEELAIAGARGDDAALNDRYHQWIRDAIRADTYRYFGIGPDGTPHDGIELDIVWEGEPGAPDPSAFAEVGGAFSMMRFGGFFEEGFLGVSGFAPYNEGRVDDTAVDRGVASGTLIHTLLSTPIVSAAFAPLVSAPLGTHDADAVVLDPSFDPYGDHEASVLERYALLRTVARYLALAIGSVTAHEMGHAMGLMPNGVPPAGFFGGVLDVSFIDPDNTNPHHADFPGLNLMQAGGGLLSVAGEALETLELPRGVDLLRTAEVLALENRLSPYSRAYLQRRLTYASFEGAPSGLRAASGPIGCR